MKDNKKYIRIKGANEHNLKNIDIDIPRDEFTVVTGLSGSGKSSLAFDTIYAEGQRRYMESLSSYARQFLGQMEKPQVESIEGLPPAISIDQKSTNKNPRSTVGTVTEIYDYMRLLYARAGIPHCPKCGREIKKQTVDEMVDRILMLEERTKFQILAPVVRGKKGRHEKVFESAKKSGYLRVRVDGNMYELTEEIKLEKNIKHSIEIIIDRLSIREGIEKRLTDSVENALKLGNGLMIVDVIGGEEMTFSQNFACPDCGISIDEVQPRSFSFNNPFGACPDCYGLGYKMEFDEDLIIPDKSLSINQGAIVVLGWQSANDGKSFSNAILQALALKYNFSLDTPFEDYPKERIPAQEFVDLVQAQGGMCFSAHPFRNNNRGLEENLKIVKGLDGIEVLNGSTLYEANRKAAEYAAELGLATVGSSDCHVPEKLGIYATYFPREIRSVQELIRSVKRCETLPVYYKEGGYYLWDMKNPIDAPFHIYEQEQMVCAG